MGINKDDIPSNVVDSEVLTGHDINRLMSFKKIPIQSEVEAFGREPEVSAILQYFTDDPEGQLCELHKLAKEYLDQDELKKAWLTILQG